MENMPWPNTLGRPAALAVTSSVCIGLKSPDAPAYITRSVRVSVWDLTGASSPVCTSSTFNRSAIDPPSGPGAAPYLTHVSGRIARKDGPAELVLDLAVLRAG